MDFCHACRKWVDEPTLVCASHNHLCHARLAENREINKRLRENAERDYQETLQRQTEFSADFQSIVNASTPTESVTGGGGEFGGAGASGSWDDSSSSSSSPSSDTSSSDSSSCSGSD